MVKKVPIDIEGQLDLESRMRFTQAQKQLNKLLNSMCVTSFTKHASEEMEKDNLKTGDIFNVLNAGRIYDDPENINDSWRYRVETKKILVVVAFANPNKIRVITAWRK